MDINKIDYIPMLLDVNALPSLELYIKLSYVDKRYNKVVKVERDKKYRIVYHKDHHLHRIVGRIVDITRVFNEDINYDGTKKKPDYIITIDASTEYGSNVKKLYVYQIRAIKEYVEHMDEDNTILDATTIGGTTSSSIIKNATVEIEIPADIIADNPDGTEITIPELEVAEGIITDGTVPDTGTTTGGLSTGENPNGNKILVNKGTTHGGTIIHGTIIKGKMYNVTIIINRSNATYIINGDINNTIINGTTINGGTSIGGEVSIVNKENTIVFGGVIYGDTMVTIGGTTTISKDPDTGETIYTTTGGTTTGGTLSGGNAITTIEGTNRVVYINNGTTIGGTSHNTTIIGGTVYGGSITIHQEVNGTIHHSHLPHGVKPGDYVIDMGSYSVGDTITNTIIYGGNGTAGVTIGGTTTGGDISVDRPFDVHDIYRPENITIENMKDTTIDYTRETYPNSGDGRLPKKYPGLKVGVGDITGVLSNFHGNDEECDNTDIN